MKKYGIYLAYPPAVDLRVDGLGRHLAEFLKAAQERGDVRFAIACPSWMSGNLERLFKDAGVRPASVDIIAPPHRPWLLWAYEYFDRQRKKRRRPGRLTAYWERLQRWGKAAGEFMMKRVVRARGPDGLVWLVAMLPVMIVTGPVAVVVWGGARVARGFLQVAKYWSGRHAGFNARISQVRGAAEKPQLSALLIWLYRLMEEAEAELMRALVHARKDIRAWYCPTAFWPHFNELRVPRLMCVPDVVLTDFSAGFALERGDLFLDGFRRVENSIRGGMHLVTYSEDVKRNTLIKRYHIDASVISVVPHGANRLDNLVLVTGFPNNDVATDTLCRNLFKVALNKAVVARNKTRDGTAVARPEEKGSDHLIAYDRKAWDKVPHPLGRLMDGSDTQFIFYASQFRANKNLLSLLRAYEHLLRRRYIGHKLVLTGNPATVPAIAEFIADNGLENDVLCLNGLSAQELAACYRLADLAVNPSLSEGGCPFTFTEALSVGTPVVMARIPVTEEVITQPDLQDVTFFDPFDWKDMAEKIEWALQNADALLEKQMPFYQQLAQRSWRTAVDEYVEILDRISAEEK